MARKWTRADVDAAEAFYKTHNAGFTPYPFPRDLFNKFIAENDGYFPIMIEALAEGSVCYTHTPVFIITAEGEYSRLVTFMETILTMVSPSPNPSFPSPPRPLEAAAAPAACWKRRDGRPSRVLETGVKRRDGRPAMADS